MQYLVFMALLCTTCVVLLREIFKKKIKRERERERETERKRASKSDNHTQRERERDQLLRTAGATTDFAHALIRYPTPAHRACDNYVTPYAPPTIYIAQ